MFKSIEKLIKILNLETQNKFANKAIIGGLDKYLPNWTTEAKSDQVPQAIIEQMLSLFSSYAEQDVIKREGLVKQAISTLKENNTLASTVELPTSPEKNHPELNNVKQPGNHPSRESNEINERKTTLPNTTGNLGLQAPVSVLQGIGSVKKDVFHSIGINKIEDLFNYFPRRYDDYSQLKPINRIEYGEELTVIATVQSHLTTKLKGKDLARVEVIVSDGTGFLRLVFFRSNRYIQSFESHFRRGAQLVISGKVTMYLGRKQINNPNFEMLDQDHLNTNGIIPVYPLTAGLSQKDIRTAIKNAVSFYVNKIQDYLPTPLKRSAELMDLPVALHQIHYPDSYNLLNSARNRIAFDEVFFLQLGVQQQKREWHSGTACKYFLPEKTRDVIVGNLGYKLTSAQEKVIQEILEDLGSGYPMNRLIQGDVGSGKTVVAAITSAAINLGGGQTAFMAPTSILAEQHYRTLQNILVRDENTPLPLLSSAIRLLTGDTSNQERIEIDKGLQDGSVQILIGTHALLESPVSFKNLQLAIIDEQHRFGIAQRSALRQKGTNPHLLVMSATPIPRSLALTIFGDLDISIIDEMPAGRKVVETQIIHPFARDKAYQLVSNEIKRGNQAFIIYPLIESTDNEDQKAAVEEHSHLQQEVFPDLRLGLLHGRMPPEEKESVMRKFRDREYDILVSTTVIEVGLDIPNATLMLIEGANRFGLAQLHQLRGRVGRGGQQAYCLMIPENEDALENERLMVMTETNDGFILAEKDLSQRGPGDFIGYRQSGFADLRMASLSDIRLIEKARNHAQEIFKDDPQLQKPENHALAIKLADMWNVKESDIS